MIRRLYVHNFRCLQNFDITLREPSVLLIGKNGSGKTTVGLALGILQKIARGTNRVRDLFDLTDWAWQRTGPPMRFEIEVVLQGETYAYGVAFELPEGFREPRVLEEKLALNGAPVFTRQHAEVTLARAVQEREARFRLDWHLVALPIVQEQSQKDPLFIFKQALARMLYLRPLPAFITGDSEQETLEPDPELAQFGAWFSGLLAETPAGYAKIEQYLKEVMPDLKDIQNPLVGKDARSIAVQFSKDQGTLKLPFRVLSDGEKCFMICALTLAANDAYGPLISFWDEPDNYLALDEVGQFVLALRRGFDRGGQLIATSHNAEAIRSFSEENTFYLHRKSHLEPTVVRRLGDLNVDGDLISALIRGDVEP